MPRRARLALPEVPVHIIQRGNNRQACFFADEDYHFYIDHLSEQSMETGCSLHASTSVRRESRAWRHAPFGKDGI